MRMLIDTNIVLEAVLEQSKAHEARGLLARTEDHEFFISDFSLHSIGLFLFGRKQYHIFREFLNDMLFGAGMLVASILPDEMESVAQAAQRFNLDFDDAYQYAAANKYDLTIVSFDSHFDQTDRGRKTPADILKA